MTDATTRALLEQALEALSCDGGNDDPGHRCSHCDDYVDRNSSVRSVLRAELAKPATTAEPFAYTTGVYAGRFTVDPVNKATVIPAGVALYLHPPTTQHDAPDAEVLKAERDGLLAALKELLSELEYGHACPLTKEKSRAAIARAEGRAE